MFGQQIDLPLEQLFNMLRHFATSASHRGMENIQAELWRRKITQDNYLEWLKGKKDKEKEPVA